MSLERDQLLIGGATHTEEVESLQHGCCVQQAATRNAFLIIAIPTQDGGIPTMSRNRSGIGNFRRRNIYTTRRDSYLRACRHNGAARYSGAASSRQTQGPAPAVGGKLVIQHDER